MSLSDYKMYPNGSLVQKLPEIGGILFGDMPEPIEKAFHPGAEGGFTYRSAVDFKLVSDFPETESEAVGVWNAFRVRKEKKISAYFGKGVAPVLFPAGLTLRSAEKVPVKNASALPISWDRIEGFYWVLTYDLVLNALRPKYSLASLAATHLLGYESPFQNEELTAELNVFLKKAEKLPFHAVVKGASLKVFVSGKHVIGMDYGLPVMEYGKPSELLKIPDRIQYSGSQSISEVEDVPDFYFRVQEGLVVPFYMDGVAACKEGVGFREGILIYVNNRIIPHENVMMNYSNIWYDMLKMIPNIPICAIIWDIYNFADIYTTFQVDLLPVEKIEMIYEKTGKNSASLIEKKTIEYIKNNVRARDIYFNIQEYKENDYAAAFTINNIQNTTGVSVIDNRLHIDLNINPHLNRIISFEEFNVSISNDRVVSLITIGKNKTLGLHFENTHYKDNYYSKDEALITFMQTFFHEITAHVLGSSGNTYSQSFDNEHTRVGVKGGDYYNIIEGGFEDLIRKQISYSIEKEISDGVVSIRDTNAMKKEDWQNVINGLHDILMDPYISKEAFLSYLSEKYSAKLK